MTADLALERFVAWSPRILAAFAASACVETTRFLIEVLKRLEIDARPLPVKFLATCHAAGYQFVAGASDAEMATAKRICRGVTDRGGGGWNGHLLAVVDGRFLVDTAFAQVSAPEYGVILEPSALVVEAVGRAPGSSARERSADRGDARRLAAGRTGLRAPGIKVQRFDAA